ncbi:hypothetical protein L1887_28279 [Cichorium endivia]|nr:hypothetical protein L1887_28279 [Cichorium endivia]
MYPFERLLHELKKDVKNKARVEGSIANAYLVREASIFCSHYFEPSVHTRNRKVPRNDDGGAEDDDEEKLAIFTYPGRPYGKLKSRRLNDQEFDAAHSYILVNEEKVQPYLNEYETMLKELIPDISEQDLAAEVDKSFASWFENYARTNEIKNKYIHDLSRRPLRTVRKNDYNKDEAFQGDEVEANEIISTISEHDYISSNDSDAENNNEDEGEFDDENNDYNDGDDDGEGEFEYSTSNNEEEDVGEADHSDNDSG